jgi:FtsP/CotA-like multicopper oxidase with cupredoxin domain
VVPDAGSFWYHPHVRTNEQIEQGLYAPLVVHDDADPVYDLERYLLLDDALIDEGGFAPFLQNHMEVMHGKQGNVLLTNGQADALTGAAGQGQVERWRIVNTANARTMELAVRGAKWRVIGTDGGLIATPYTPAPRLQLPVGKRFDLEVSYVRGGAVELLSYVLTVNDNNEVEQIAIPVFEVAVAATAGQFFEIIYNGTAGTDLPGVHDTVLLPGLTNIDIIAWLDNPGRWMAHCHILEHAELGMMSEIVVTPRP